MKVALGQLDMVWEDKKASLQKAEVFIAEAAEASCDIIVFPEMAFTGFSMDIAKVGEPAENSDTEEVLREWAKKYQIAIAYGWAALPEENEIKGTNRFSFLNREGEKLGEYIKLHPFSYGGEDIHYRKGQELVTFSFEGRKISLFICYDLRFPEIFHIAAKEADIMLVIANWPAIRSSHWETLLRARAIETQSYVVGVNCVGNRDTFYTGDSMAVDCIGNILGKISGKEGILVCELEDRAWQLRKKFATAADRREDFYAMMFHSEQ